MPNLSLTYALIVWVVLAESPVNLWVFPVPLTNVPLSILYQYSDTSVLSVAATVTFISVSVTLVVRFSTIGFVVSGVVTLLLVISLSFPDASFTYTLIVWVTLALNPANLYVFVLDLLKVPLSIAK